jgi:hypothetical protein
MMKLTRSVLLEPDVIAKIQALAKEDARSFSAMAARLIDEALAARQKEQR